MKILCDIGGTFVRFACVQNKQPVEIEKYKAADFPDLQSALNLYCKAMGGGSGAGHDLYIATAGYEDEGVWKFVNQNTWHISIPDLKALGWNVRIILNDFEAATWSLLSLTDKEANVLKPVPGVSDTLCLLGPGTGLGLGYLHKTAPLFVQKTHGGHMPAAAISDEQAKVIAKLRRMQDKIVVYENLVSGPGLYNIYKALDGDTEAIRHPEGLLDNAEQEIVQNTLRLFHEFFGVFSANAIVTGHAYGGLYLTSGVLERLVRKGLFDFRHFEKFFCLNAVGSVRRDLEATPIIHITYPYPALKGLLNA